jgi:RNA polymerase sigma factor (sigma-70 family)
MTRIEMEQAVAGNLGRIRGIIVKTVKKYGAKLCEADIEDIESNTVLCLLDGRLDNYVYTTDKALQQWIGYIAMQRCVDYLRAIKNNIAFQQDSVEKEFHVALGERPSKAATEMANLNDNEVPADEALVEEEDQLARRRRLRAAVASLSDGDQRMFAAISTDGYSTRLFAQEEGVKESSIHTRRHRLLNNIRKCF